MPRGLRAASPAPSGRNVRRALPTGVSADSLRENAVMAGSAAPSFVNENTAAMAAVMKSGKMR